MQFARSVTMTLYVTPVAETTELDVVTEAGRAQLVETAEDVFVDAVSAGFLHARESGVSDLYNESYRVLYETINELQECVMCRIASDTLTDVDMEYVQYLYDQLVSMRNLLHQQLVLQRRDMLPAVVNEITSDAASSAALSRVVSAAEEGWQVLPVKNNMRASKKRSVRRDEAPMHRLNQKQLHQQLAHELMEDDEIAELFYSDRMLTSALDRVVIQIEGSTTDPLSQWLRESRVLAYEYLASMTLVEVLQLSEHRGRRQWLEKRRIPYEAFLSWVDYIQAAARTESVDRHTLTLVDLVALDVLASRM
jgi:hypothetical protein